MLLSVPGIVTVDAEQRRVGVYLPFGHLGQLLRDEIYGGRTGLLQHPLEHENAVVRVGKRDMWRPYHIKGVFDDHVLRQVAELVLVPLVVAEDHVHDHVADDPRDDVGVLREIADDPVGMEVQVLPVIMVRTVAVEDDGLQRQHWACYEPEVHTKVRAAVRHHLLSDR